MTTYLYDGLNAIIERNASGITQTTYTRGLSYGGGIGSIISTLRGGDTSYYHYDGLGSVTELTNASAKTIQSYTYDAFGNILTQNGLVQNPYGFSTKEYNSKSGLIYFGARYYDPCIGRFITKDLITWDPNDRRLFHKWNVSRWLWQGLILTSKGVIDLNVLIDPNGSFKQVIDSAILRQGAMFPQKFNRYIYCLDNPVNLIDPFGLDPEDLPWWEDIKNFLKGVLGGFWPVDPITLTETAVEAVKAAPDIKEHLKDIDEVGKELDEMYPRK